MKTRSLLLRLIMYIALAFMFLTLGAVVIYILVKGIPNLSAGLFAPEYTSENCSVLPALINTVELMAATLLLALPVGIGAAIYLTEYADRRNPLVRFISLMIVTLSGIPSMIYGLFGYLVFVLFLGWGYSLISGACSVAIMVLPIIIRTSEEAIEAVPDSLRESSYGLGAGKLLTIFRAVLPSAMPGIIGGAVLAAGRIAGETTALIYTAGTAAQSASLTQSGRTMAVHMYSLWNEGLARGQAYGAALVLLAATVLLNLLSDLVSRRLTKELRAAQ